MADENHLSPPDDLPALTETPRTMSPPSTADGFGPTDSIPIESQNNWSLRSMSAAEDELTERLHAETQKTEILHSLSPYKSSLTPGDLESVIALESACFPPELKATREKIIYRLAKSAPLNVGLFTSVDPDDGTATLSTYTTARSAEGDSTRRAVLVAHILATLTTNETVKDEDMALPENWNTATPDTTKGIGHKVFGRTICIHSLSVLPELQGSRIGTTLLKTFIQLTKEAKNYERISLLTWERLVPWYERFGFENQGKSHAQFGGEPWYDMVLEFPEDYDSEDEELEM